MRTFIASIALATALATGAQADVGQMRVRIGDIDLSTEAGARQALARIDLASRQFCTLPADIPMSPGYAKCRREMMALAVEKLDAPQVTALAQPAKTFGLARK